MIYVLFLAMLFGGTSRPLLKEIGKGEIGRLGGVCQNGTRSHMQMLINLVKLDKYSIALLEEWVFGRSDNQKQVYKIQVDGKKLKAGGETYFSGMYTYSPVFVAIYKRSVKWGYVNSNDCHDYAFKYPGKGISFYPTTVTSNLKPCNIMTLNNESVEIAPLFTTSENHVFLIRAQNEDDSMTVIIARSGELKRNIKLRSGEVYIGIMDNGEYDIQIGSIDINLPEALELLEK